MKRAARWAFNIAAIVSLVILVATIAIILRTDQLHSAFIMSAFNKVWRVTAANGRDGRFGIMSLSGVPNYDQAAHWVPKNASTPWLPAMSAKKWARWGIEITRVENSLLLNDRGQPLAADVPNSTENGVTEPVQIVSAYAPRWMWIAGSAALPAVWASLTLWITLQRRHRRVNHLCMTCGYDLRATPGRCPECGAIPENAKGAAT